LEKTDEAVRQLQQAHKLNPNHPDALKLLAAQHMTRRDFSSAITLLRPVLTTSLADEEIYLLLIESLQTIGDTNGSFELSQRAVKLFPASPPVNCWMGFQLQFSGRYDEAKKYLNQALRISPDYSATYYLLADILLKEQNFKEAVPYFRKAVAAKPDDVDARIGLGQALTGLERLEEALNELQEAARIAPQEARVHFQLSRLYFRLGDEKRAEQEAELSVKLRPQEPLIVEVPSALRGGTAP
jgi:tetratricopeptide (TPR) repeat protein